MMLEQLREGDKVVVYRLNSISRSTKHLIALVGLFIELGVDFVSLQDNIDTSTTIGKHFYRTITSLAQLEKDVISVDQLLQN